MKNLLVESDERKIYFARKAVHIYKTFTKKYARATDLVKQNMNLDDTFAPLVRVSSVKMWRKWKRLIKLLDGWIKKEGIAKFNDKQVLNTCIVVLRMMINDEQKRAEEGSKRVDIAQN